MGWMAVGPAGSPAGARCWWCPARARAALPAGCVFIETNETSVALRAHRPLRTACSPRWARRPTHVVGQQAHRPLRLVRREARRLAVDQRDEVAERDVGVDEVQAPGGVGQRL